MTTETAKALWIASFEASKKYHRNLKRAQFIAMDRGPDPFVLYADLLARLQTRMDEAFNAAMTATIALVGAAGLPEFIETASAEWSTA